MTTTLPPARVATATPRRLTPDTPRVARAHRGECDLALLQVQAIDTFNRARRSRELAMRARTTSREMRLDNARTLDALRRQHQALVARTQAQLHASGDLLRSHTALRVVLAHRNAWFLGKASAALEQHGVTVLAQTDNGADAIGYCVAEQPDLLLLEDTLAMLSGEEVIRQARQYVPTAVIAAQTGDCHGVARLADAGADAVFTRQVPPPEIVQSLLQLSPV